MSNSERMFPLLRYFSIGSFAALALVAALIVAVNQRLAVQQLIERGELTNVALTYAFANSMWPRFAAYIADVPGPSGDELRARSETAEIHKTVRALIHDLPVLKVKIYNLEGLTLYSTEESQIGEDKSNNAGFLSAARDGRPASKLSLRGSFSTFSGEVYDRHVIETYVPVHIPVEGAGDETKAVFEFYSDVTPMMARIDGMQRTLVLSLAAVFGLLYGALFLMIRRADRILKQQYGEIIGSQQALRYEKQAAEVAAKSKGEFLANMSHEIRTPMTAILGFTDFLAEGADDRRAPSEEVDAIETIQRNGEYLLQIINEILDLSKIEAGRLEPECVAFSPAALVEGVVALMRPRAEEKGLFLEMEIDGSVPSAVEGDPTRIRQILINLVGNALKFTDKGGVQVAVGHRERPGKPTLSLAVTDTGIGMAPEDTERIFEAFTQADGTATRKYVGTGLGLTICERLSLLLGGRIEVESELGRGSVFRVNMPVTVVDRSMLRAEASERPDPQEWSHDARGPIAQLLSGCRILVAEDGRDNQRLIALALQRAGAEVELADDGAMAVESARVAEAQNRPFSAVLMDMQMPVLDGYEAAKRLRQAGYPRPIIALTAHAMPGDRQKCLETGCSDYAAKPINSRRLIKMIARHLRTQPHDAVI